MRRRLLASLVTLLAAVSLAVLADGLRAEASTRRAAAQRYEDVYYLPPTGWLSVFSLGWDEALADLIWMRALIYFGDELQHGGNVENVFEYAEAIAALDPHFAAVYRWVGTAGVYRPVEVRPEHVERAVAFMERGAREFPEDGELAWDIGATLVFELVPLLEDPEAQDDARVRGTPWLMRAARLGAAPEWAALSNASLLSRIGRSDQAARHLEEMYLTVSDPRTRERIAARIRQLRRDAQTEAFVAAMQDLEALRRRQFPYVSLGLYLMIGPRPPVDVRSPIQQGLARALADDLQGTP